MNPDALYLKALHAQIMIHYRQLRYFRALDSTKLKGIREQYRQILENSQKLAEEIEQAPQTLTIIAVKKQNRRVHLATVKVLATIQDISFAQKKIRRSSGFATSVNIDSTSLFTEF